MDGKEKASLPTHITVAGLSGASGRIVVQISLSGRRRRYHKLYACRWRAFMLGVVALEVVVDGVVAALIAEEEDDCDVATEADAAVEPGAEAATRHAACAEERSAVYVAGSSVRSSDAAMARRRLYTITAQCASFAASANPRARVSNRRIRHKNGASMLTLNLRGVQHSLPITRAHFVFDKRAARVSRDHAREADDCTGRRMRGVRTLRECAEFDQPPGLNPEVSEKLLCVIWPGNAGLARRRRGGRSERTLDIRAGLHNCRRLDRFLM